MLSKITDPDLNVFVFVQEFFLSEGARMLETSSHASILSYLSFLGMEHIGVYSFLLLTSVIFLTFFFVFIYNKIKTVMLDSNTLLKVLPLETLDRDMQEDIKSFILL